MARIPVPDQVQNSVLLKSRRRCCLCFWLNGLDEVVKGQIAHLDRNNENAAEDNIVFLCHNHHDEYDGMTSTSKGLREGEVRKWRNELYREMEYRFRSVRKRDLSLKILQFAFVGVDGRFTAVFKLTNVGEVEIKRPTVSIKLPSGVNGEVPRRSDPDAFAEMPALYGMVESIEDLFEPNGRVGIISPLPPLNSILLTGHSVSFDALGFNIASSPIGTELTLEYRIDAEDMTPICETLHHTIAATSNWFLRHMFEGELGSLKKDSAFGRAVAQIYTQGNEILFEK
jgi:hypothetical protein